MVERTRELENALGDGVKRVEGNEADTVILQRRCLRTTRPLPAGHVIVKADLEALRPAPDGALAPYKLASVVGRSLKVAKDRGDAVFSRDLEPAGSA